MSTPELKAHIESTVCCLRDLAYEANSEWQKQGMSDPVLHKLATTASLLLNDLAGVVTHSELTYGEKPSKIREVPSGSRMKIQAIKSVRTITGEGLKEAKDIVDKSSGAWSDLSYKTGFDSPDEQSIKEFTNMMSNAGYEVK